MCQSLLNCRLSVSSVFCFGDIHPDRTIDVQKGDLVFHIHGLQLTVVLAARCLSQALPLFSATLRRLTGSYGCLFRFSSSCPFDKFHVVIIPPARTSTKGLSAAL